MNTRWGDDDERWQVMEDLTADLNAGHTCITGFGYGDCAACMGHTCVSSEPDDDGRCIACEDQAFEDACAARAEEEDEELRPLDELGSNIARAERWLMIAAGALVGLIAVWMWWA